MKSSAWEASWADRAGRADIRPASSSSPVGWGCMGECSSLPVHEACNGHTGSAIPRVQADMVGPYES